jgi:hypothetical protein
MAPESLMATALLWGWEMPAGMGRAVTAPPGLQRTARALVAGSCWFPENDWPMTVPDSLSPAVVLSVSPGRVPRSTIEGEAAATGVVTPNASATITAKDVTGTDKVVL